MNKYKITYTQKGRFFEPLFDYYTITSRNAKDAIRIAQEAYKAEFELGFRNLAPIKEVKFIIVWKQPA